MVDGGHAPAHAPDDRIGPHELEPVGTESAFWQFALRHALLGQSFLVTRGIHWDVAASVDGDEVRAFGRKSVSYTHLTLPTIYSV